MSTGMPIVDGMAFDTMAQFSAVAGDLRDPYPDLAEKRRDQPVEAATYASFIEGLERDQYVVHRYDDVVARPAGQRHLLVVRHPGADGPGDGGLRAGGHGRARAQAAAEPWSAWPSASAAWRPGSPTPSPW